MAEAEEDSTVCSCCNISDNKKHSYKVWLEHGNSDSASSHQNPSLIIFLYKSFIPYLTFIYLTSIKKLFLLVWHDMLSDGILHTSPKQTKCSKGQQYRVLKHSSELNHNFVHLDRKQNKEEAQYVSWWLAISTHNCSIYTQENVHLVHDKWQQQCYIWKKITTKTISSSFHDDQSFPL